jgi:uncharacterized protein (DUF1697 family)
MPIYIAMLRGINVGGHKRVEMSRLRASCEALGFEQVRTYIQSGNVIFQAGKNSTSALSRRMEEMLLSDFGFSVSVITRTSKEMGEAIQDNPFLQGQEKGIDPSKMHLTFLSQAPPAAALKKLETLAAESEKSRSQGREIYLHLPDGYARTKLTNNAIEKLLSLTATTRNWNTVNQLYRLSLEP